MVGFKYKISNVQAAIGCAQMERIEELVERKREILNYYRDQLEPHPGVSLNPEPEGTRIGAWMPNAVFDPDAGVVMENLQRSFAENNIDARVFFHPLSKLSMFDDQPENKLAYDIASRAINLPSYHDLTEDEQQRVVSTLLEAMQSTRSMDTKVGAE